MQRKKQIAMMPFVKVEMSAIQQHNRYAAFMKYETTILLVIIILLSSCHGTEQKENNLVDKPVRTIKPKIPNNNLNDKKFECYNLSLKWSHHNSNYFDTIVTVRNYQKNDSSRRIICNSEFINLECENLIWNDKHIAVFLEYLGNMNRFALISSFRLKDSIYITHFYLVKKNDLKTVEMNTFLIYKRKIVGMKMFPWTKNFIPIEEFDKFKGLNM